MVTGSNRRAITTLGRKGFSRGQPRRLGPAGRVRQALHLRLLPPGRPSHRPHPHRRGPQHPHRPLPGPPPTCGTPTTTPPLCATTTAASSTTSPGAHRRGSSSTPGAVEPGAAPGRHSGPRPAQPQPTARKRSTAYGWAFSKPVRKVYYNLTITGLIRRCRPAHRRGRAAGSDRGEGAAARPVLGLGGRPGSQRHRIRHRRTVLRDPGGGRAGVEGRPYRREVDGESGPAGRR